MFASLLPYAEAIVGAGLVALAFLSFLPMKRYFSSRPLAPAGGTSVRTELTVVSWIAMLLIGIMLLYASVQ